MKIKDIKPYARNARDNTKSIPAIAESIKNFGFVGQIVLRSQDDPTIVAGHHRVEAVKSLGWTEIPDENICYCDNLTDEEIKALRLADNRTHEGGKWNVGLLKSEVKNLEKFNFDMSKFNFDFKSKESVYGAMRLRTDYKYNLDIVSSIDCNEDGMPKIKGCLDVPEKLIPFNIAMSRHEGEDLDAFVHFFIDDYQFERLWNAPQKYLSLLKKFKGVLSPDFSLYMDMPYPMQMFNEYRKRALQNYWERNGINVIPTLAWSDRNSYDFCFSGIPINQTVAMSTVGIKRNEKRKEIFIAGVKNALLRTCPKRIILYGGNFGFDFGDVEVIEFKSNIDFRKVL